MDKICTLCKINIADQNNSHIIPKFMSKRLFENAKPRHALYLGKNGKQQKQQDIPKENQILCRSCEAKLAKLEDYFARFFIEINSLNSARRSYTVDQIYGQEVIFCNDLHPTLFKLFIFSLIWRCSISKSFEFGNFKLENDVEENLRIFLYHNLKATQRELLDSLNQAQHIPDYHYCVTKPKGKVRGILTAFNFAPNSFTVFTVDYAIFFYTNENPHVEIHKKFSNKDDDKVKIAVGEDQKWIELNQSILDKMRE
jgi:hypothetical protein